MDMWFTHRKLSNGVLNTQWPSPWLIQPNWVRDNYLFFRLSISVLAVIIEAHAASMQTWCINGHRVAAAATKHQTFSCKAAGPALSSILAHADKNVTDVWSGPSARMVQPNTPIDSSASLGFECRQLPCIDEHVVIGLWQYSKCTISSCHQGCNTCQERMQCGEWQ